MKIKIGQTDKKELYCNFCNKDVLVDYEARFWGQSGNISTCDGVSWDVVIVAYCKECGESILESEAQRVHLRTW